MEQIMSYEIPGYHIYLLRDRFGEYGVYQNSKLLPCLGQRHGWDMFWTCVDMARGEVRPS